MPDYHHCGSTPEPSPQRRRLGRMLGAAGKTLFIIAAIVLTGGGLGIVALGALATVWLNHWASNK